MKFLFATAFKCLIFLGLYHGGEAKGTTTSSPCPTRSAIDSRGPPGFPGNPGEKNLRC